MNIIYLAGWSHSFMATLILQANALCLGLPAAQSSVFRSCLGHTHYLIVILMQQLLPKLPTDLYTCILIWLLLVSAIFTQWVQSEVISHVNPKVRSVSFSLKRMFTLLCAFPRAVITIYVRFCDFPIYVVLTSAFSLSLLLSDTQSNELVKLTFGV